MYGFRTASRMNSPVLNAGDAEQQQGSGETGRANPARISIWSQKQEHEDDRRDREDQAP